MSTFPKIDIFGQNFYENQDEILNSVRDQSPFAVSDRGTEILGYSECRNLLRDRRVQKDHMALVARIGITHPEVVSYKQRILVSQGLGDERNRMRGVLTRSISHKQMERMRSDLRSLIDGILDNTPVDEEFDYVHDVAALVPPAFFCQWTGLPVEDARRIGQLSDVMLKIYWMDPKYAESIQTAYLELFSYLDKWLESQAGATSKGDFISHLLDEQQKGNVHPNEVRDWIIFALEGSSDNTVHQIGLLLARLLENPELWEQVLNNPDLVLPAIEESLRLDARTRSIHRLAIEDIEVPGGTIRAGTDMFFSVRAAHLDRLVFDDPETFDIHRRNSPGPLLFGGGAYSCIGQWMARVEVEEGIRAIIDRFPNIQLTGTPERAIDLFSLAAVRLPVVLNGSASTAASRSGVVV